MTRGGLIISCKEINSESEFVGSVQSAEAGGLIQQIQWGGKSTMSRQPVHNCEDDDKAETATAPFIPGITGNKCS